MQQERAASPLAVRPQSRMGTRSRGMIHVRSMPQNLSPLWDALALDSHPCPVVAVVGGGGKTSLIHRLCKEAAALGRSAVFTGTSRFTQLPDVPTLRELIVTDSSLPAAIASALKTDCIVVPSKGDTATKLSTPSIGSVGPNSPPESEAALFRARGETESCTPAGGGHASDGGSDSRRLHEHHHVLDNGRLPLSSARRS